jgi:hypothetical protein
VEKGEYGRNKSNTDYGGEMDQQLTIVFISESLVWSLDKIKFSSGDTLTYNNRISTKERGQFVFAFYCFFELVRSIL